MWDALVAVNQVGMELFAQQDLKGLMSHYTSDGTLMFPGMDTIQGKDAIEQQLGKFYEMGATEMVLETKEVGSLGASDEMAYERGYNRIISNEGELLINGKYVTLWKKLEGQWLIYCKIFTSNT